MDSRRLLVVGRWLIVVTVATTTHPLSTVGLRYAHPCSYDNAGYQAQVIIQPLRFVTEDEK